MREYVAMGSYGKRWGKLLEAMASLGEGYGKQCGKLWAAKASHRGGGLWEAMGNCHSHHHNNHNYHHHNHNHTPQPPELFRLLRLWGAMGQALGNCRASYGELWEAMGQATGSYGEQRNKYNNHNHKRNQELTTFG